MPLSVEQKSRWKRRARNVAIAAIAAELLYVGAINIVLKTHLLRGWVSRNPDAVLLDYDDAWSIVPFVLHVKNLTLRGRSTNVEWFLRLDRADVHVVARDLLRRRFHTSEVDVDGLVLYFRFRLDQTSLNPLALAALPDIAGFANPPLKDAHPPLDDGSPPWKIELLNVDVIHTKEVWVHSMRYSGDAHVTGCWFLDPDKMLDVGPAHVNIESMQASYGHALVVDRIHGGADIAIDHADVSSDNDAPKILHAMSVHGVFDADVRTELGLSELLDLDGLALEHGHGPLHIDVAIGHGILEKKSGFVAEPRGLAATFRGVTLTDALHAEGHFVGSTAHASLTGADVTLARGHATARIAATTLAVDGTTIDLAQDPFSDAKLTLDVRDGITSDISAWVKRDDVDAKTVHANGHATYQFPARDAAAEADVDVDGGSVKKVDFRLDFAAAAHLVARAIGADNQGVSFAKSHVALHDATLHLIRHGDTSIARASEIAFEAPTLDVAKGSDVHGVIAAHSPQIDFVNLLAWSDELGLPANLRFVNGTATTSVDGQYDLASHVARGTIDLHAPQIGLLLGDRSMLGALRAHVHAQADSEGGDATDVGGSFVTFRAEPKDAGVTPWWISIALPKAHLAIAEPRFTAHLEGHAKDASPAGFWAKNALTLPMALDGFHDEGPSLRADLTLTPLGGTVRDAKISDGTASLKADFASDERGQIGAALLALGDVHVAINLGKGTSLPIPPGAADSFFDRKHAAVAARERR